MLTWQRGRSRIFFTRWGLTEDKFVLVTIHRDMNTDDPVRLTAIFSTLMDLAEKNNMTMVMPLHPRTMIALRNRVPLSCMKGLTAIRS